jgi:4-aminobutyrate aminotransferase-like enzyme
VLRFRLQLKKRATMDAKDNGPHTNTDWIELHQKYRLKTRYVSPIVLERGEGLRVWDVEGREYLDFHSGQVCAGIGHSNPEFAEIMSKQLRTFVQSGSIFTVPTEIEVARLLAEIAGPPFAKSVFACSGAEAVECSLRLAKFATGKFEIISVLGAYHGMTGGSFFVSSSPGFRSGAYGAGMPGVVNIALPNEYRCEFGCNGSCTLACARQARKQIEGATSGKPAAFISEFLFSSAGVIVPPKQWVEEMRRICDDFGMLYIADEAQTGLGRTGEWFAFNHFDVKPDIIVVSKTLGGGIPLSAVIVTDAVAKTLESNNASYSSSHSGDPFLAAAGIATIGIMKKHNLLQNIRDMGAYLKAGLQEFVEEFEIVGRASGLGLKLGMEFVEDKKSKQPSQRATREFTIRCRDKGLILGNNPERGNVVRILPGFTITREQVDWALQVMRESLEETTSSLNPSSPQTSRVLKTA